MSDVKRIICQQCNVTPGDWPVERVIAQDSESGSFCVEWAGLCPHSGLPFAWTWEPKSRQLKNIWKVEQERSKQAKAQREEAREAGVKVDSPELKPLILPDLPAHMVLEDGYETEEEKEDVKSEADADYYPTEKARRKASSKASKGASGSKRKEKPLNIPYTAKVFSLAPVAKGKVGTGSSSDSSDALLDKIRKILNLAEHPGTPEAEANAAFKRATRLISENNVTMAATAEAEGGEFTPGASIIKIHHTSKKKAFEGEWIVVLSRAVETAHDVKSFSRHNKDLTELEIVFYGIAINTATAATTFEMAFNLIIRWTASKQRDRSLTGNQPSSYKRGVADGLMEAANKYQDDIKAATERREAQEIARRAAEETEAEELIKAQQARLQPRLSSSRTSKRGKNTYQPASHDTASPPYPSASASPPPSFAPTSDGFDDDDDDDGASAAGVFDFFDGADDAGSMTEGEKSEDTEEEAVGEGKTTEDDHGEGSGAEDDGDEETGEEQEQIKATEGKGKEKARETPFDKPADPQKEDNSLIAFPSAQHLALFRAKAEQIANAWLKSTGIELVTKRGASGLSHHEVAYQAGKTEATDIVDITPSGKRSCGGDEAPRKQLKIE